MYLNEYWNTGKDASLITTKYFLLNNNGLLNNNTIVIVRIQSTSHGVKRPLRNTLYCDQCRLASKYYMHNYCIIHSSTMQSINVHRISTLYMLD